MSCALLLLAALPSIGPRAASDDALKVGAAAPAFELVDQDGRRVTLASLSGRSVVLAFYPKDLTPG